MFFRLSASYLSFWTLLTLFAAGLRGIVSCTGGDVRIPWLPRSDHCVSRLFCLCYPVARSRQETYVYVLPFSIHDAPILYREGGCLYVKLTAFFGAWHPCHHENMRLYNLLQHMSLLNSPRLFSRPVEMTSFAACEKHKPPKAFIHNYLTIQDRVFSWTREAGFRRRTMRNGGIVEIASTFPDSR